MGGFGGYFKGEKKKNKKGKSAKGSPSDVMPFVMPEVITKKKKEY